MGFGRAAVIGERIEFRINRATSSSDLVARSAKGHGAAIARIVIVSNQVVPGAAVAAGSHERRNVGCATARRGVLRNDRIAQRDLLIRIDSAAVPIRVVERYRRIRQ